MKKNEVRPYELTGSKYALWYDCGQLGFNVQTAVGHYLVGGAQKIVLPHGKLDERSKRLVKEFAAKRGVLIPQTAFEMRAPCSA